MIFLVNLTFPILTISIYFFLIFCGVPLCIGFLLFIISAYFFYFGSVYGCSVEFTGRMFRFSLAWLVRSN